MASSRRPFELLAHEKGIPASHLAALKAHKRWPTGRLVTEKEFDDALKEVRGETFS